MIWKCLLCQCVVLFSPYNVGVTKWYCVFLSFYFSVKVPATARYVVIRRLWGRDCIFSFSHSVLIQSLFMLLLMLMLWSKIVSIHQCSASKHCLIHHALVESVLFLLLWSGVRLVILHYISAWFTSFPVSLYIVNCLWAVSSQFILCVFCLSLTLV